MKTVMCCVVLLFLYFSAFGAENFWEERFVPGFMITAGVGIAGIWTMDLVAGDKIDFSRGLLRARDTTTDQIVIPHLIAEYTTAGLLFAGAIGILTEKEWGRDVSYIGLGALCYTATNSLSWVLSEKERLPYGIPMFFSLAGGVASMLILR